MYKQSDKKKGSIARPGAANQTSITNFFAKKPESATPKSSQPPVRDFAGTYLNATRNSSSLSTPSSGYQPYSSNAQGPMSSQTTSAKAPINSWTKPQRVFNSTSYRPDASMSQTSMAAVAGPYSGTYNNKKGMSKPPSRGGPLTGNGSGVYIVSKKPATSTGSTQQSTRAVSQTTAAKKRAAPWGAKNPESIRFSNPPPSQSNPFREKPAAPARSRAKISRSQLSPCQLKVVDAIFNRRNNVFFTGSAGISSLTPRLT